MRVKVVYNNCYGGFSLSKEAIDLYKKLTGISGEVYVDDISRHNSALVKVVETLRERANGYTADLCIKEIKGNKYVIKDNDGIESIIEPDNIRWIEVKE